MVWRLRGYAHANVSGMIIVDSSVWIDYFSANASPASKMLDELLGVKPIAVGDLILTEVLQGNDSDYQTAKTLFEHIDRLNMLGGDMAIKCAENFRALRKKGGTIRKTADVIIVSYCIENNLPLLFSDKNFKPLVEYMNLAQVHYSFEK